MPLSLTSLFCTFSAFKEEERLGKVAARKQNCSSPLKHLPSQWSVKKEDEQSKQQVVQPPITKKHSQFSIRAGKENNPPQTNDLNLVEKNDNCFVRAKLAKAPAGQSRQRERSSVVITKWEEGKCESKNINWNER